MRNANEQDAKKVRETGVLEEYVMYRAYGGVYVHGKKMSPGVEQCVKDTYGHRYALAERADGMLWLVDTCYIKPILPKGPAQTPKKPRRTPVKGTRPERKIAVGHRTELKVGDVVELVNKSRHTIRSIDQVIARFFIKFDNGFWAIRENIKYLILPYKEEQKKPVTYSVGQRFVKKWTSKVFMIAQVEPSYVALIQTEGRDPDLGNRWSNPVHVCCISRISEKEFDKIAYGHPDYFSLKQD